MAISDDEKSSFIWGGQRARPRKGIERVMRTGETYLKPPGSCNTKHAPVSICVEVECCDGCGIYVLDQCEQVQISECTNCRIVVGPCVGSVMLFDCTDCTIAVAGKQVRLRDCQTCELRTFAPTSECVVIETSKGLKFGCWDIAYPGLATQFAAAGWPPEPPAPGASFANYWDKIFDFSPATSGPPNWTKLPGCDAKGRWCELTFTPTEGSLTAGTVVEARADTPAVSGCECPCAAQDGKPYEATWFDPTATALLGAAKKAAADAATKPAIETGSYSVSTGPAKQQKASAAAGGGFFHKLLVMFGLRKSTKAAATSGDVTFTVGQDAARTGKKPEASTACNVQ